MQSSAFSSIRQAGSLTCRDNGFKRNTKQGLTRRFTAAGRQVILISAHHVTFHQELTDNHSRMVVQIFVNDDYDAVSESIAQFMSHLPRVLTILMIPPALSCFSARTCCSFRRHPPKYERPLSSTMWPKSLQEYNFLHPSQNHLEHI